ncbi:AmmeMemoRadiSam system protein B [Fodinibius roseus]|uniref:AmmeMemoRadiSam system protein B n=1 Tax=Fodinibius roseus TaxID=1194090 RepID=A0A1M5EEQ9_9BACT|nr:AmmeMemoRadiSam system protein B [Fodinibius roseus]SHF77718.1 AmmeMemoRadiSam system protein B [Fodinibius roseus]
MSNDNIFNSKTNPIPPLRPDLEVVPIRENGNDYLYFHDQRQYATSDLALRREIESLLSLIDGHKSINDLESYLGEDISKDELLDFIKFLDKNRLLYSDYFKTYADKTENNYEERSVHSSVTAGRSYPSDPDELAPLLDNAFAGCESAASESHGSPRALYAPHIDPQVAMNRYAEAFATIKEIKPQRVVVLATAHYAGLYPDLYEDHPFILVNKDFELPLGDIKCDRETVNKLSKASDCGITLRDRAHRMEHSIELPLLFLSYLWKHDFTVVPFLVSGLQELMYMEEGHHGTLVERFSTLLADEFTEDEETFFLISGDLSHFGRKFGDEEAATAMFEEVGNFDEQFLEYGVRNDPSGMLQLISEDLDPYRICGFPPLYTFLKSMPGLKGTKLNYDLWDERERKSAVTFGSILYSVKK